MTMVREARWSALLEVGLIVISLLLFWAVLFSRVPPSVSQYFHRYSLGSFLIVLVLYCLSFRLPGKFQLAVCLGMTMALFALTLSYLWTSGFSDNFIIGGLLPYKDGKNFYFGANLILNGLPVVGANQATERPLFPGFLASLLFLTGQSLKIAIAILVQLMGAALYLAARQIRRFGAFAAGLFATLSYFYIQPWIGYTMSETLGFTLGCFGFTLITLASHRLRWFDLFLGLAILLIAVSARAGAFFVLPMLAIWMGWAARGGKGLSLRVTGVALMFLLVGYVLVNTAYARLLDISPGSSFGNFSYALYGQVRGGTGWHRAIEELGTRNPSLVYRAAWEYFLEHPLSLFIGFAKSYRDFFLMGDQGIFPFWGNGWMFWLNFVAWLGALSLVVRGLTRLFRDIHSNPSSLLLAGFAGLFLSIPFLPPIDGGTRFYAGTVSFFFVLPAVGVSGLMKGGESKTPLERDLQNETLVTRFASIAMIALTLVMSPILHSLGNKPILDPPVCPADQTPFVMEVYPGGYIDLVKDTSSHCGFLPEVCLNDFESNNVEKSVDDFYQELLRLAENSDAKARIVPGIDFVTGKFQYSYVSDDKLLDSPLPRLIAGCAVSNSTKNQTIYQVESIVSELK